MSTRLAPALAVGVLLLPVLALLGRLALFAGHSAEMLAFPWEIDFDEGVILHSSWLLANGQTPYPPITADHFVSSVYPPLFYALNAVALKIWGLNLWSGRALSLLGTLLAAGSLVAWTFAETRSRAAGLIAAALWLSSGPVIVWATFYKQDVLALGFGALGGAMLAWAGRPNLPSPVPRGVTRLAWLAILPLVLAFWTKQSTLAPLAAAGLYMLGRDRRSGLRWCLGAGAALTGPFLLLNVALGGQLYIHLFLPGAEALSGARLGKNLGALWGEGWPVIVLAGVTALALLGWAARTVPALSVLYAAVSMPALLLTNLSPLANYNHLLIGLLPLCLLAGVGLGHAASLGEWRLRAGLLVAGVAVLLVQPALLGPIKNWYTPLGQPLDEKATRFELLERAVADAPGSSVLTEDAWLALRAGKALPYDDPAMMTIQANSGHWDQRDFLNDIARRRFGLVVLEQDITGETDTPRWSAAGLAALQANYAVKSRDVRFLAAPRAPPAAPPDARDCALAGGPRLVGFFLPGGGARLAPGDVQQLSLYWAAPATATSPEPLKFSLLLRDPQGKAAWQADLPPGAEAGRPWPSWPPGASPRDDLQVPVPATAPPGVYTLVLSAYVPGAGGLRPVPFVCGAGSAPSMTLATPRVAPAVGP
ncbi:MAG: ArnT family glycosyltransferase [Chloroflexia bacterium]